MIDICPTHVGMNRVRTPFRTLVATHLPHACGDEPLPPYGTSKTA